ncbi:ribosome biogenesis protein WDR12 isoform X1 [Carex littledalei]|uniref:Ribosome biogenesis protein WDR12 isoform X1 n=1 Tax=Carex littledalei TaxID=544730 RepID=A0A833QIR4_9POAL|nr:ribosome biogenesis protein WDR12 isoform X1 [Carex littledalei]
MQEANARLGRGRIIQFLPRQLFISSAREISITNFAKSVCSIPANAQKVLFAGSIRSPDKCSTSLVFKTLVFSEVKEFSPVLMTMLFILTGCYDGLARIWEGGEVSECTHILEGHNGAITSAKFIEIGGVGTEMNFHVVTGSKDRLLRLWKCDAAENRENPIRVGAYKIFPGHTEAVQSVTVNSSREMICSGSWDCSIKLWDVKDSEEDGDGNTISLKKRKVNCMTTEFEDAQSEGAATSTLMGHTQCVSAVTWPDPDVLYSASWDHSIRQWDIPSGKETWTMVGGKALNCLDIGGESSSLVAAGGSDPVLRIWDPRKPGSLAPIFQFSSHASWISECKWHPRSWFHLLSASYDGKVMLWDLRTAWPLAIMDSHQDKVLCADWWKGDSVVSGGADSKLRITSGIEIE